MTILFYTTIDEYGCFCNFSRHGVELDGKYWPSVEHYFQGQKFAGTAHAERIRCARTPKDAKRLGHDKTVSLRADWEQVKDEVMRQAVLKKFQTHAKIREVLLATGEEEL